jgi:hypothetical protein
MRQGVATIFFLGNAFCGSANCVREVNFAVRNGFVTIPVFLEWLSRDEDGFERWKEARTTVPGALLDADARSFDEWRVKADGVAFYMEGLQGVPADFFDLSEWTCEQCRSTKDSACAVCADWSVAVAREASRPKLLQAARALGKYIDRAVEKAMAASGSGLVRIPSGHQTWSEPSTAIAPQPEPQSELRADIRAEPTQEPEPHAQGAFAAVDQSNPFCSCLDREYVQKEIRWALQYRKKIIVIFEKDQRRAGFFDHGPAWAKYGGTEWEAILNIDAEPYMRDEGYAQVMVSKLMQKGERVLAATVAEPARNSPGCWDFFLSHAQATGGDQAQTTYLRLQQAGNTVWYDNAMLDKSTAAMEEGVKHSRCFLLFLSGDTPATAAATAAAPTIAVPRQSAKLAPQLPVPLPSRSAGGLVFCFSYASEDRAPPAPVSEAKAQLEAAGHRVFWGLDVSPTSADWRKDWNQQCETADYVVNFLTVAYVRSPACAGEWCFAKDTSGEGTVPPRSSYYRNAY